VLVVVLAALTGGCQEQGRQVLSSEADLAAALRTDHPALVDFYKDGCPTCAAFDPVLDALAREYQGRAAFFRFQMVHSGFIVTSPEVQARYDIDSYPTAILFVKGREVGRWVKSLEIDDYRKALDEALGRRTPSQSQSRPATSQPAGM
jgi:thioredoxin-like negative regulator of GroEL